MAGIDHLDLVVGSLDVSLPFYRGLLEPLGWRRLHRCEGERGETINYLFRIDGRASIGLRERQSEGPAFDRYAVGVHHVAFAARSRRAVDRAAAWARDHGATIESGPEEYAYSPGYYAVFLYDPDGIKLEIVKRPSFSPRVALWALRRSTTPFRPENVGRPR